MKKINVKFENDEEFPVIEEMDNYEMIKKMFEGVTFTKESINKMKSDLKKSKTNKNTKQIEGNENDEGKKRERTTEDESTSKKQKKVTLLKVLPPEVLGVVLQYVSPNDLIKFTKLNNEMGMYLYTAGINYEGTFTLNPKFDLYKHEYKLPFVTSLKMRSSDNANMINKVLEVYPNLKSIDLESDFHYTGIIDNKIGNIGAEAIAKALKKNTTLTSIDLWGNFYCIEE
jgi:hypothetical protein